jgi:hypothetical protein
LAVSFLFLAGVPLVAPFCATVATANEAVGYIAVLSGDAEVVRGTIRKKLSLGEIVYRGDVIATVPPSAVAVDTRGGRVDICSKKKDEQDCVRSLSGSGAAVTEGDWLARAVTMMAWFKPSPRNLVARSGEPPRILIGSGRPQKVVGGRRSLTVAWTQGTAPFKLKAVAGGKVLAEIGAAVRTATLPAGALAIGSCDLVISDSEGRSTTLPIEVVGNTPSIPDLNSLAVNPEHRQLLEAAWLADRDNGAWLLEAYQRVGGILEINSASEAMARALASGDRP